MKRCVPLIVLLLIAACAAPEEVPSPSPTPEVEVPAPAPLDTLARVRARERLICGVSDGLPGFNMQDGDRWQGFYVDFCRAIAAAVLGNPEAVQFRVVSPAERFAAIQKNDVDILLLHTPHTLTRDAIPAIGFGPPVFHDQQAIMVRGSAPDRASPAKPPMPSPPPIQRLSDLNKRPICVESGMSTRILQDFLVQAQVKAELLSSPDLPEVFAQYRLGKCVAVSADLSQLLAWRSRLPRRQEHRLLPERLSWEPLSPVINSGDDRWRNIVTWVIFSTIHAEELGITRQNYATVRSRPDPQVARFLGIQESLGIELGLDPDWTTQIMRSVGNYGEIFDRNLSPLGIPRAENRLRRDGGRVESMPFR
ncbi:MAG: transporter substrate-binding domain-containing protein [Oscillatoriales cyanobacterium SM2_2_1]|nr:transporter substrate-binding domain-containing protein [Oscillatoriales cyanobacterium SM2_2_1]